MSIDWREVKLDISNDLVYWNALSPSFTDWRWGRSILQCIYLTLPINENDDAPLEPFSPPKQLWPMSINWRAVRFDISNDLVFLNALPPNLTDWSWGNPSHQLIYSVLPIKMNESAELKQFSPISTVSSASNSVNSNDFVDWNTLLLILNDRNDFISTPLFQ